MNRIAILFFVASFWAAPDLFGQEPDLAQVSAQPAPEIQERATVMGQAARDEFEQKQFSGQVRKLRDGLEKGDFNKVASLQSSLANSMRREIGQLRLSLGSPKKPVEPATPNGKDSEKKAEKSRADEFAGKIDLDKMKEQIERMQQILNEVQGFTFMGDNREAADKKIKLLEEFGQILQKNMVDGYRRMGPIKPEKRD